MKKFVDIRKNEAGITAIEYALVSILLSVIGFMAVFLVVTR